MKIAVIAPGIKEKSKFDSSFLKGSDSVLLLNPIYQQPLLPDAAALKVLTEDAWLDACDLDALNERAKRLARGWFLESQAAAVLDFRGINLGSLFTHALTYYFFGLIRAVYLFQKIFKFSPPTEILLYSDGSYWSETLNFLASRHGAVLKTTAAPVLNSQYGGRENIKHAVKNLAQEANRFWGAARLKKGGVLFSSSLRYALPFIRKTQGSLYLRDVFSLQAFSLSLRQGFRHLVPGYFRDSRDAAEAAGFDVNQVMARLDGIFRRSDFFIFQGINLWEIFRKDLARLLAKDLGTALGWISRLSRLLGKLSPAAVFVDEDVCFFNKTLVECARMAGVSSYRILNGVPFFDIGNVPMAADKVLVWGKSSKDRLLEWGLSEQSIEEVGAPQYESFAMLDRLNARKKVCEELGIHSKHLIVLATQPFHTNERPDYFGSPLSPGTIKSIVSHTLDYLRTDPGACAAIKFHPGEKMEFFTREIVEKCEPAVRERVRFVRLYDTPSLLAAADLVLTIGSTVYFEALLLKTPVFIFDYPSARFFEFMGKDFLDIENSITCRERIRSFFEKNERDKRIAAQEREIESHFRERNAHAAENILELLAQRDKVAV